MSNNDAVNAGIQAKPTQGVSINNLTGAFLVLIRYDSPLNKWLHTHLTHVLGFADILLGSVLLASVVTVLKHQKVLLGCHFDDIHL
jgi:hypothetical protein